MTVNWSISICQLLPRVLEWRRRHMTWRRRTVVGFPTQDPRIFEGSPSRHEIFSTCWAAQTESTKHGTGHVPASGTTIGRDEDRLTTGGGVGLPHAFPCFEASRRRREALACCKPVRLPGVSGPTRPRNLLPVPHLSGHASQRSAHEAGCLGRPRKSPKSSGGT